MPCDASPSRARRLRNAAVKRSLYERAQARSETQSVDHLLSHGQKLDWIMSQMEMFASHLQWVSSSIFPYSADYSSEFWCSQWEETTNELERSKDKPRRSEDVVLQALKVQSVQSSEALCPTHTDDLGEARLHVTSDNSHVVSGGLRHWVCGGLEGSYPSTTELKVEAAIRIQSVFRGVRSRRGCSNEVASTQDITSCIAEFGSDGSRMSIEQSGKPYCPTETTKHDVSDEAGRLCPEVCMRCEQPSRTCICWNIHCRQCLRFAEECNCLHPIFKRRTCSSCGCRERDGFSLFDKQLQVLFQPLPTYYCSDCGCSEYESSEYYSVQSAKKCLQCCRLGYHEMQVCDRASCQSKGFFHKSCMHGIADKFLCPTCAAWSPEHSDEETAPNLEPGIIPAGWPDWDNEGQSHFQAWVRTDKRRIEFMTNAAGEQKMENLRIMAWHFHGLLQQ